MKIMSQPIVPTTMPSTVAELPAERSTPAWAKPLAFVGDALQAVSDRREALGLVSPGTIEDINKEVSRDVFLTNYFFTGLRADVAKSFSMKPGFQVSHSLSIGSQFLPPYALAAVFNSDKVLLQGNFESSCALSGRAHYAWSPKNLTAARFQIADGNPAMVQLEQEYAAKDYSIGVKALNPSFLTGSFTGVIIGSYLQSLTSRLALGLEAAYSRYSPLYPPEATVSYYARYATPGWIASGQLLASGSVVASFWRKVTDKVEAGIESTVGLGNQQAMLMGGAPTIEGQTTVGARYEFRQSLFRGQIDSLGRTACIVEQRVLPMLTLSFSGEIDHFKNVAKVGLGLQLEMGSEEVFEQQQKLLMESEQVHPGQL